MIHTLQTASMVHDGTVSLVVNGHTHINETAGLKCVPCRFETQRTSDYLHYLGSDQKEGCCELYSTLRSFPAHIVFYVKYPHIQVNYYSIAILLYILHHVLISPVTYARSINIFVNQRYFRWHQRERRNLLSSTKINLPFH